jgi:predicted nucleic acid-binding protein
VSDPEGLLDTSAVLALHRVRDPSLLPDVALISAVTLAELSVGALVATGDVERARRLAQVQQAEADFDPIPFDAPAARAYAQVAAAYRRSGRKPAARSFDAMIAATAIANDLPLHTANPADVAGIEGRAVRAVPAPSQEG